MEYFSKAMAKEFCDENVQFWREATVRTAPAIRLILRVPPEVESSCGAPCRCRYLHNAMGARMVGCIQSRPSAIGGDWRQPCSLAWLLPPLPHMRAVPAASPASSDGVRTALLAHTALAARRSGATMSTPRRRFASLPLRPPPRAALAPMRPCRRAAGRAVGRCLGVRRRLTPSCACALAVWRQCVAPV